MGYIRQYLELNDKETKHKTMEYSESSVWTEIYNFKCLCWKIIKI